MPATAGAAGDLVEPACVSVDLVDENHSLRLAIRRLATDRRLREALGRRARRLWTERFTLDRMISGYRSLIEKALALPGAGCTMRSHLPLHLVSDGTEHATAVLRSMGLSESQIARVWTPVDAEQS
jgi:hypothetical protein